jgi:hypothetical protein
MGSVVSTPPSAHAPIAVAHPNANHHGDHWGTGGREVTHLRASQPRLQQLRVRLQSRRSLEAGGRTVQLPRHERVVRLCPQALRPQRTLARLRRRRRTQRRRLGRHVGVRRRQRLPRELTDSRSVRLPPTPLLLRRARHVVLQPSDQRSGTAGLDQRRLVLGVVLGQPREGRDGGTPQARRGRPPAPLIRIHRGRFTEREGIHEAGHRPRLSQLALVVAVEREVRDHASRHLSLVLRCPALLQPAAAAVAYQLEQRFVPPSSHNLDAVVAIFREVS